MYLTYVQTVFFVSTLNAEENKTYCNKWDSFYIQCQKAEEHSNIVF